MKALLSFAKGGPETLRVADIADPQPGPGQIRIAVKACGVNYPDTLIIEDKYQFKPQRPFSPGGEVAGIVDALGENVEGFSIGDRVIGSNPFGGMAEKLVVSSQRCTKIPDAMPFTEAAAFLMTYGTSFHALKDRAAIQPGETLLVLGASGGVGLAAVELGVAMGAKVVAAASTQVKLDIALAHGAASGFVYPAGPFDGDGAKALSQLFKEHVPDGVDVAYDPVGGDYSEAALRSMRWNGRHLVVGFAAGLPRIPLNLPLLKSCQIVGVFWGAFLKEQPEASQANNAALLALYQVGRIRPEISETFALDDGGLAIARLASRQAVGKLVITIQD
jgi:NADPH2:quinone reductase